MIVAGASLIIALIVCTMCIAGNVYRRKHTLDDHAHGDWPAVPTINQPRGD